MTEAAGLLGGRSQPNTTDPKKPPALKNMSSCEKAVSGVSLLFWAGFGFFGWLQVGHALSMGEPMYEYVFQLYLIQGGAFIYLAVLGFWMSFREAFMEIDHYLAMATLEVIQFILFVTAAFLVLVGPWALEGSEMSDMNMMTLSQLVALIGIVLALIHLCVGVMRPQWRKNELEQEEALKRAQANAAAAASTG